MKNKSFRYKKDKLPPKYAKASLRSHSTSFRSGHITRDKRFGTRLMPHPNFSSATLQKNFFYPETLYGIDLWGAKSQIYETKNIFS